LSGGGAGNGSVNGRDFNVARAFVSEDEGAESRQRGLRVSFQTAKKRRSASPKAPALMVRPSASGVRCGGVGESVP
jgi:hypothetical protein